MPSTEFQGFGTALRVTGGESIEVSIDEGDLLIHPSTDRRPTPREEISIPSASTRLVFIDYFNGRQFGGDNAEGPQSWNGKPVWIIAHGWNGNNNALSRIAESIQATDPDAIVLGIDWRQASHTEHQDGAGAFYGLDGLFYTRGANFYATSWVGPVAEVVAEQLKAWGVPGSQLNLVGHSIGAYLTAELAYQMGGVDTITALEPATDVDKPYFIEEFPPLPYDFGSLGIVPILTPNPRYEDGYRYPRRVEAEWVAPPDFKDVSRFSRAFVGASGALGNVGSAASAHESIVLDFGELAATEPPRQHGDSHLLFSRLVTGSQLTGNLLSLKDYQPHSNFAQNSFNTVDVSPDDDFEGVLVVRTSVGAETNNQTGSETNNQAESDDDPPQFTLPEALGFYAKKAQAPGFYIYGRDIDDIILTEDADSEFLSMQINDHFIGDHISHDSNTYYLGAGSDRLVAGFSDDEIYGDFPREWLHNGWSPPTDPNITYNDTIEAGGGNDTIYGGQGNDTIKGDGGEDIIEGESGEDRLYGGAGSDTIRGGTDDDEIHGEGGDDKLLSGEGGTDRIHGGEGTDTIKGGDSTDNLYGGSGTDTIYGDAGDDIIEGGDDNDIIYGGSNSNATMFISDSDTIKGGAGDDQIWGEGGIDYIYGGDNADTIDGGAGADYLYGESGDDTIKGGTENDDIHGGLGGDLLIGNSGNDNLYGDRPLSEIQTEQPIASGNGYFTGYSNDILYGDEGDDFLEGGVGNDELNGGNNNDHLYGDYKDATDPILNLQNTLKLIRLQQLGQTFNDTLRGDRGNDHLYGGLGNDTLDGGDNNDHLHGGQGDDTLYGGNHSDVLHGNEGTDHLWGDRGADELYGGLGSDILYGGDSDDQLYGDYGYSEDMLRLTQLAQLEPVEQFQIQIAELIQQSTDELNGGAGADLLEGGLGNDTLRGGSGNDHIYGDYRLETDEDGVRAIDSNLRSLQNREASFDDRLYGDEGRDRLHGGFGNDQLEGGSQSDHLYGDEGNDSLKGGTHNDILFGGEGKDLLFGEDGNDDLYGGDDDDQLHGGEGIDTLEGGKGKDILKGAQGNDTLSGDEDNDILEGGDGKDQLKGEDGNDILEGGRGSDTLMGGDGNDILGGVIIGDIGITGNGYPSTLSSTVGSAVASALDVFLTGIGEVDRLTGGDGADKFILGDRRQSFYAMSQQERQQNNLPLNPDRDYAIIEDYDRSEGDQILVHGDINEFVRLEQGSTVTFQAKEGEVDFSYILEQKGTDVEISRVSSSKLDVVLLADLTQSFKPELESVQRLMPSLIRKLQASYADVNFGLATFTDKYGHIRHTGVSVSTDLKIIGWEPSPPGWGPGYETPIYKEYKTSMRFDREELFTGWTYSVEQQLTNNVDGFVENLNRLDQYRVLPDSAGQTFRSDNGSWSKYSSGGFERNDVKESQLDALFNLALGSSENIWSRNFIGFRPQSARIAVLATDAPFHQAGDAAKWGITTEHDGIHYSAWSNDYVSIPSLRSALLRENIIPIFAVTTDVQDTYKDLVTQLGFGAVVPISATKIENEIAQIMGDQAMGDRVAIIRNTSLSEVKAGLSFVS
jgi:Ca2+-binding RTX toxin-like protein/pimeloyl-ACP methyl ester carboxylesterase